MNKKQTGFLTILSLTITLLACNSSDLLATRVNPTLTPTFELARYATPTTIVSETPAPSEETPPPTTEPTTEISGTDSAVESPRTEPNTTEPIPTKEPTVEPTTEPTAKPTEEPTEEAESVFQSPVAEPEVAESPAETDTVDDDGGETEPEPTAETEPVELPPLSGRIAFPVDDGGGHYDIWVIELPDGEPFQILSRARQPNFSSDGRLLVNNHDSQYGESLGLLGPNYEWQGIINDSPDDAYPFWSPDGRIYVYSNPKLLLDPVDNNPLFHVFMPCSMQIPAMEGEGKCRDLRTHGKVTIGEAPVWTDDDRVAYFTFEGDDGIYVVSGVSALWQAGGVGSSKLLINGNGRPTDTAGFQVFFSAGDIDGNWEAYAIDLDGTNLVNLSNAPFFQDGLPTVSPDGNWVAFVSDRDGKWGIWVTPRSGGEPQKVVDISTINTNPSPWGVDDRAWMTERISWGP